jgi:hypothetical protein
MPLDGTEFAPSEDHPLVKLAAVERLLATRQQWCQGKMRDEQGRHCLVGAMEAAQARQTLEPIVLRATRQVAGKRYWRIEFFNDDPRTTHADVLRVLRRARDNIMNSMIDDDRRGSWRQMLADSWRALLAGPVAKAYAVLRPRQHEPQNPIAVIAVAVSFDQVTCKSESAPAAQKLCDVS